MNRKRMVWAICISATACALALAAIGHYGKGGSETPHSTGWQPKLPPSSDKSPGWLEPPTGIGEYVKAGSWAVKHLGRQDVVWLFEGKPSIGLRTLLAIADRGSGVSLLSYTVYRLHATGWTPCVECQLPEDVTEDDFASVVWNDASCSFEITNRQGTVWKVIR